MHVQWHAGQKEEKFPVKHFFNYNHKLYLQCRLNSQACDRSCLRCGYKFTSLSMGSIPMYGTWFIPFLRISLAAMRGFLITHTLNLIEQVSEIKAIL